MVDDIDIITKEQTLFPQYMHLKIKILMNKNKFINKIFLINKVILINKIIAKNKINIFDNLVN